MCAVSQHTSERAVLGSECIFTGQCTLLGIARRYWAVQDTGQVYHNGQCMVLGIAWHLRLHSGAGQCTFTGQFTVLGSGQCVLLVRCPE